MFVQVCTRRIQYFHKLLLLITGMICDVTIVPYKPAHTPNSGVRACLHEGGGPQIGEVTRLGGVTPKFFGASFAKHVIISQARCI